jgi:hypothetical protein
MNFIRDNRKFMSHEDAVAGNLVVDDAAMPAPLKQPNWRTGSG